MSHPENLAESSPKSDDFRTLQESGRFQVGQSLSLRKAGELLSTSGHNPENRYRVAKIEETRRGPAKTVEIVVESHRSRFRFDIDGAIGRAAEIQE